MADASAISFLFDGLTALHGGPLDDASGFIFYRELYGHLDGMVKRFGFDLFGRMLVWVSITATSLLTFWIWVEGYRILTGRSQRSMAAFLTEMVQAVAITFLAAGAALGGSTLYDWVGHDLGRMVHRVLTGQTGDVFESIDRTLGYMQLAFGFIDEIQTGGSEVLENAKDRNLSLVAVGMGGPAIIAGALLLTYKVMLALSLGFAPLFVLCLLFPQTKPLFWGWLNHLVGALFALSVLHVMAAIATNMICAVAATFWTAKLTGASVEGVNSLAMQQGGLGLLLTTLIIGAPAAAAKFFKGLLGDFSPYSAFANGSATRASAQNMPHAHTYARAHAGAAEYPEASVHSHAHRVATPARSTVREDLVKPADDARSFLERYPNATASLARSGGRGDVYPSDLKFDQGATPWSNKLGPEADKLAAYSPTLQADIARLANDKWDLVFSDRSRTNRHSDLKTISIDAKWRNDPEELLRALSHEVGHARHPHRPDYSTKEKYLASVMEDEAAALMKNIQIRREIMESTGGKIDIGINGSATNHDLYNTAYDQFLKDGDRGKALRTIGERFGQGESVSVPGKGKTSYNEYYGSWYDQNYGH